MKRGLEDLLDVLLRYAILIIFGLTNLTVFYFLFTPLTVQSVYFLLSLFHKVSLVSSNFILIENFLPIEIIKPCIAGSAYYLLLILNLSTPNLNIKKRIRLFVFSSFLLLLLNILRIFVLSLLFLSGTSLFDITHELFWYFGSVVFVVGIWFLSVKMFKIKEIPFYSDFVFFLKHSGKGLRKKSNKSKRSKKH